MTRRPTNLTLVLALLCLLTVCVAGAYLSSVEGAPFLLDHAWHTAVETFPGSPAYTVAVVLAALGSAVGVSVCVGIIAVLFLTRRRPREALILLSTAIVGVAASEVLKALVSRPRPMDALLDPPGFSFPSGHSMGAAMLATAVVLALAMPLTERRSRGLLYACGAVWVLLVMWSRTALHVHWLSDTVAGALLGWGIAVLVRALILRIPPTSDRMTRS